MNIAVEEIFETIEEIKGFLPRLRKACESTAELFYDGMTEESWGVFHQVIAGLDDLYTSLYGIDKGLLDANIDFGIQPIISHAVVEMESRFSSLNDYIGNDMHVAVGDIMKYEFISIIQSLSISFGEKREVSIQRFKKNSTYLKLSHPDALNKIEGITRDIVNYQLIPAKDGTANIYIRNKKGHSKPLYSLFNPLNEAKCWAEATASTVEGIQHILVYGLGLGHHLSAFSRRCPNMKVHLIEPDEQVLLAAMYAVELELLFEAANVQELVVGVDKSRIEGIVKGFYYVNDNKVSNIDIPMYNQLYYDQKVEFKDIVHQEAWSYIVNIATMKFSGLQHTKNILYNLSSNLNTPSLSNKYQVLSEMSAVIVGAGPSLEKDVEVLKRLRDYVVIIAAGSAIQSLQHFGITPHLVVSMDGGESNYDAFKHIDRSNIPFVYLPQIEYRIVDRQLNNTMHAFLVGDTITSYLMGEHETDPIFEPTYSVTGTAIQIAAYLGCKEIIFTGQDLSYPTESMYAPGAKHVSEETKMVTVTKSDKYVENVQSGKNKTDMKMQTTLGNIEEQIEKTRNVTFINASQLGAKIEHTRFEPLKSVLDRLSSQQEVGERIKQLLSVQGECHDSSRQAKVEGRLRELPQLVEDIDTVIKKVKERLNTLLGLSCTNPDKCLESMADIEDQWGLIVSDKIFTIIYAYAIGGDIHEFDRKLPKLADEKNIENKAKLFVEILGTLIDKMADINVHLLEYIDESIMRIDRLNQA